MNCDNLIDIFVDHEIEGECDNEPKVAVQIGVCPKCYTKYFEV